MMMFVENIPYLMRNNKSNFTFIAQGLSLSERVFFFFASSNNAMQNLNQIFKQNNSICAFTSDQASHCIIAYSARPLFCVFIIFFIIGFLF